MKKVLILMFFVLFLFTGCHGQTEKIIIDEPEKISQPLLKVEERKQDMNEEVDNIENEIDNIEADLADDYVVEEDTLTAIVQEMSLEERVYQMFVVLPNKITEIDDSFIEWFDSHPVGGFMFNADNVETAEQLTKLSNDLQTNSNIPLLIMCDEEGGRVARVAGKLDIENLNSMYYYKDLGPETAFENAYYIGSYLREFGINIDLAPVADIWSNPENKVIGTRAYSDNAEEAAILVDAAVRGFHESGIGCTLKHFPGHGNTATDTHNGAVYVNKIIEELNNSEFLPFMSGINAGADMIMVAHVIVPDISDEPSLFSYELLNDILRKDLRFDGVIITDALKMKALTNYYSSDEIIVKAVNAGADILLEPDNLENAVNAILSAIQSGEISEERINQSINRILLLKENLGLL